MADCNIGSYEAKTHFAELLDRVASGERITITRHGTAVAVLEPAQAPRGNVATLMASMRVLRASLQRPASAAEIREWTQEGRT